MKTAHWRRGLIDSIKKGGRQASRTNLGKLQKRLGRCDLSPVGGVGGEDGKLGFLADWIWGLLRMEFTETLGPGAGQGGRGGWQG